MVSFITRKVLSTYSLSYSLRSRLYPSGLDAGSPSLLLGRMTEQVLKIVQYAIRSSVVTV